MLAVGCLVPFVLLAAGAAYGSYVGGNTGGYWGAGAGLGAGLLLVGLALALLKRDRRG